MLSYLTDLNKKVARDYTQHELICSFDNEQSGFQYHPALAEPARLGTPIPVPVHPASDRFVFDCAAEQVRGSLFSPLIKGAKGVVTQRKYHILRVSKKLVQSCDRNQKDGSLSFVYGEIERHTIPDAIAGSCILPAYPRDAQTPGTGTLLQTRRIRR